MVKGPGLHSSEGVGCLGSSCDLNLKRFPRHFGVAQRIWCLVDCCMCPPACGQELLQVSPQHEAAAGVLGMSWGHQALKSACGRVGKKGQENNMMPEAPPNKHRERNPDTNAFQPSTTNQRWRLIIWFVAITLFTRTISEIEAPVLLLGFFPSCLLDEDPGSRQMATTRVASWKSPQKAM